jgi:AAA+ superfamily predicted ATPase
MSATSFAPPSQSAPPAGSVDAWQPEALPAGDPYLGALLGWLHRLLGWQVAVTRATYGALADDEYRGLYVPDGEVDLLTAGPAALPDELTANRIALDAERAEIERRADGSDSPLLRIGRLFDLDVFARDTLLLTLAPELDLRYERLYAYIQDDVTRKRPTVDLALRLLIVDQAERVERRTAFAADAPLLRHRLIDVFEDGQRQLPLLARSIKLDDAIVAEFLGQPAVDPQLASFATLVRPTRTLDELILPPGLTEQVRHGLADPAGRFVLAVQGPYGSGRHAIAEAVCAETGTPLLTVDLARLAESDLRPDDAIRRILRDATRLGAAILWHGIDRLLHGTEPSPWRPTVLAAIDEHGDRNGRSFLPLDQPWEARGELRRSRFLRLVLPPISFSERARIWRLHLDGDAPDNATIDALAGTFRLTPGQIRDAVAMARALTSWDGGVLQPEHLYAACRGQSSGKLDSLAHKIATTYDWDDIVLPADHMGQLREICAQMRHRRVVLEEWGFDRHLAMGKGLNTLFAGPSGTGKTMAAEIVAADLGLELYKVDLSTLVSKYIGETEKNLDRIFAAAQEANAILFFDEADAIFGKRSEVKDAHDRYANIEVGYLLQKMEEYDGVVILATNLRKNIDDAFIRRMHMTIEFPFPEEPDRLRIWQKVFPPEAPVGEDVDFAFLARQFKVTGGNIRNIALLSAFLAAEEGRVIGMTHVVRAIKREYQKLGKLVTESDFGPYLSIVRG